MKDGDQQKATDNPLPIKTRSERRAAKIAQTKIAESAKILASTKIIATAGLEKDPAKTRARRTKSVSSAKGTPTPKPPILPKIPLLVFDGAASPVPNVLSLLASTSYDRKPSASTVTASEKTTVEREKPNPSLKRKSSSSIVRNTGGLLMECQSDDLSPVQWATYRRAENEYLEVLRKLARWKSRPEVEIVYLNENGSVPSPPKFMSVSEAAKLPLPKASQLSSHLEVVLESKPLQAASVKKSPSVVQIASAIPNASSGAQTKILVTMQSSGLRITEARSQGSATPTSQAHVMKKDSSATVPRPVNPANKIYYETKYKSVLIKYPELDVKVAPQKLLPHSVIVKKKEELDKSFKSLLTNGTLALEKWMLEKGLFGATRYCLLHSGMQMKLMYMSTVTDDYRRSGYKWWCPSCAVMVPVGQGSFFSKWRQSHSEVLRLIYHWACNTDIQKVIQEFAYNGELVNSVFMALRAICNAQSVHWHLGGIGHSVEIAELQLGACQDLSDVYVYCAYDRHTRLVLLGAASAKSVKNRLSALFKTYISRDSTIVGDRMLLPYLPPYFRTTFVCSSSVGRSANLNASSYLRDHVASVLQDRLKHMKLYVIQAKLDELSWREKFGKNPQDAFSNILTHIKQGFVCSVVTTKGANSMPITMASGLKVVDTTKLQASVQAAAPLTVKPESPLPMTESKEDEPYTEETVTVEEDASMDTSEEPRNDSKPSRLTPSPDDTTTLFIDENSHENSSLPNTTPVVIIENSDGEMTIIQGTLKKPKKPVCQDIKVAEPVPQPTIPLDTHFYAMMDGDPVEKQTQDKKYKFKCPACKKIIEDNLKVMKHLHGHIEDLKQLNLDLSDLTQCKYCFRKFASPYAMQSHVEEVHVSEPQTPVCRICDKEFGRRGLLIRHMQSSHVPSEMPYSCYVCKYRTSFYRDAINHFHEVHGGTERLQCHYCLQVFTIRFGQNSTEGATYNFYRHLYKHQTKSHMRRCHTCCLSFLSHAELQDHRINDHVSFKDKKGVKPVTVSNLSKAIMFIPGSTKRIYYRNTVNVKVSPAVNESEDQPEIEFKCIECKTSLYRQNHFIQRMNCSMCSFITTCSRAFADHAINVHSVPPRAIPKPYRSMSSNVCCLCGFHTFFGDKMARHLSKCVRSWCYFEDDDDNAVYPNRDGDLQEIENDGDENAFVNVDGDDDNHDDDDDDKITLSIERENGDISKDGEPMEVMQLDATTPSDNDDKHNMLNVLGLMRVPSSEGMHTYSRKSKTVTETIEGSQITGGTCLAEEATGNS